MKNYVLAGITGTLALVLGLTLNALVNDKMDNYDRPQMIEHIKDLPSFRINQDLVPKDYTSIVRLEDADGEFFCSGSVISDDYVLTAAHCLSDNRGHLRKAKIRVVAVAKKDGDPSVVIVSVAASRNARADYGLIKGDFKTLEKIRIETSPMKPATETLAGQVVNCGFAWGANPGVCYPVHPPMETVYSQLAFRGTMYPGMSGGPVITVDEQGPVQFAVNTAVGEGYIVVSPLIGLFETLKVPVEQ